MSRVKRKKKSRWNVTAEQPSYVIFISRWTDRNVRMPEGGERGQNREPELRRRKWNVTENKKEMSFKTKGIDVSNEN